jgi:tetratricopeptide (TPR) repeat protein
MTLAAWPELVTAEVALRRALGLQPANAATRANLGLVLYLSGRIEEARAEVDAARRICARDSVTLHAAGMIAAAEGRFGEAEDLYRNSLKENPEAARTWLALTHTRRLTSADTEWMMRAEQDLTRVPAGTEACLRFALGKFYDDIGQYAQAFCHYQRGNLLLKGGAPAYSHVERERFVDNIMRVYTREALAQARAESISDSTLPILIVGMPRTGTTLTEQILASHPAIGGAGELAFWHNAATKYNTELRTGLLDSGLRRELRDDYLRMLTQQYPAHQYVIDNANALNLDHVGLFHSVFPRGKIIYLRRDPIDTCLSCYFQPFYATYNWTYDLTDLAHYYTEHARLVAHWRSVLPPESMLEVPYEGLVTRQEHWTRKMLEFLGLDWDERCMQFHRTQRVVTNASCWQVRQPMYRDSLHRARNYMDFIGPLADLASQNPTETRTDARRPLMAKAR